MFKVLFLLINMICSIGFSSPDEVVLAKAQLDRAVLLVNSMTPVADRIELARLNLIRRNLVTVKAAIEKNGLAHAGTMRSYQQLIVTFRYSNSFLKQMETALTEEAIKELFDISEAISKDRGFDDTPYTQITANVFSEMYQLILQLKSLSTLPAALIPQLDALVPKLGNVIAVAKQGDRPRTFEAAVPLSKQITALYSLLEGIQHSNPAFEVVLDIQGLNEFYSEYAQIEGSLF